MPPKGVSDTTRRSWDEAAYAVRAAARLARDDAAASLPLHADGRAASSSARRRRANDTVPPPGERVALSTRRGDALPDVDALAGTSVVVGAATGPRGGAAAFYCAQCDVQLHDSSAYVNHVNGRYHLAVMGVALRVEHSSVAEVRAAFEAAWERRQRGRKRGVRVVTLEERVVQARRENEPVKQAGRKWKKDEGEGKGGEGCGIGRQGGDGATGEGDRGRGGHDGVVGEDGSAASGDGHGSKEDSAGKEMASLGLPTQFG